MDNELRGSDLTRAMLERGDENVWCAIADESDEQAMTAHDSNAFTAHIVAFKDGSFYCTGGMRWLYAVPIKIKEILQHDKMY
ncbi:hypothetical protein [Psychrobacter sp. DAB_AL32B]|uniref:hypothetical protein n=1 Tax=Psychrobacter sp. DAB_AL32B TaxID=1028414 RepID=UPI000B7F7854|nr:hypothetical protein [Psychrobacter sp. DAB_AL32B]OXL21545.1 hypothetical protein CAN34_09615 [Psychrobacter sp. DAB_AL32B]